MIFDSETNGKSNLDTNDVIDLKIRNKLFADKNTNYFPYLIRFRENQSLVILMLRLCPQNGF